MNAKSYLRFLFSFLCLAVETARCDLASVELNRDWLFAREPDVEAGSAEWLPAVVPGTVLTSYFRAGKIPDPDFDDNIAKLDQAYYNVNYRYRTKFKVPAEMKGRRLWLDFDGVNWKAEVSLNGKALGRIDGAFVRGRFDVTDKVRDGSNDLDVRIIWCDGKVEDMPSFLCTISWDFMPAIPGRDVGIYKPVRLVATGDVTLRDACVTTDLPLPDTSSAKVSAVVTVSNASGREVSGELQGAFKSQSGGDKAVRFAPVAVTLAPGETREVVVKAVTLKNPELWWPVGIGHGRGDRPLYRAAFRFVADGKETDRASVRFGVREYSYEYSPGGKSGDLVVCVNGRRVLVRGGNWAVPDNLLAWTKKDFDIAVEMHRDMGFNMIRTWHGAADFDALYDACDRCGVMVYEDFWLNGWTVPHDRAMFVANLKDKVKRLSPHPCIAIWCGENEASPPGWCAKEIPAAVATDPEKRLYVPSSNSGVVSGGITYAIQDPGWFYGKAAKFCTEAGAITVPAWRSMKRMMRPENLTMKAIGNKTWDLKGWNFGVGNKQVGTYRRVVTTRYGFEGDDFRRFCDLAQYVNYESYKYLFESWNANMYDPATGVLLWMSNPTGGTILWQVYDAYKAPTGGYWGSKHACEDVHVQWSPLDGAVKAVNHTSRGIAGKVTAKVYGLDGKVLHSFVGPVRADANAATRVTSFLGTDGGVNLAEGRSAKGTGPKGETDGANGVDGNFDTRWTAKSDRDMLTVDLGGLNSVDHAAVYWENAYASKYAVELSRDGTEWERVADVREADGGNDLLPFEPRKARYARLLVLGNATMWNSSVYEFKVLEAGTLKGRIPGIGPVAFISLEWRDAKGALLSRNFYWTGKSGTDYTEMATMPKAEVVVSAKASGNGTVAVALENKSSVCAVGLWLDLLRKGAREGEEERILPAWWSGNLVSLAPGEKRTLAVSFSASDAASNGFAIELSGLNAARRTLPVE